MTSLCFYALGLLATLTAASDASPLGLDQALTEAYHNNPKLLAAQATASQAEAQARLGRAPLLPQISGQAGYLRSTSNFAGSPGSVPLALSSGAGRQSLKRSQNYYSFGITLNQLVWDFGATYNLARSAFFQANAQQLTARDQMAQIALQVRTAFFSARASRASLGVAEENKNNQEKHRQQIAGQVDVGGRPEIDLLQAKTDTSNARVQLIQANANYRLAKAQLNSVIGREAGIDYEVLDEEMPPTDAEGWSFMQALDEALSARPDLHAAITQLRAQTAQVVAAKGSFFPAISLSASVTDAGAQLPHLAPNWRAGATLAWPLFGGGQSYFQVASARAASVGLAATVSQIRQTIRLGLCQARLTLQSAKEQVAAAEDARQNARSLLRQAEARYQAGVSSVIELGDAQLAQTQAEMQQVAAQYGLSSARATYLRALGRP